MDNAKRDKISARMYDLEWLHKQDRLTLLRVITNLQYILDEELFKGGRGKK